MFFSKRRHLFRIISDESRLNKVAFALLSKYLIYQFSLAHCLIYRYTDRVGKSSQFFFCFPCNIKTSKLLNSIGHRYTRVRCFKINCMSSESCFSSTIYCYSTMLKQTLCEIHHPVVIFISHIDFHRSKLWVMSSIHSLIAEVLRKLINPIKTSYNKAF